MSGSCECGRRRRTGGAYARFRECGRHRVTVAGSGSAPGSHRAAGSRRGGLRPTGGRGRESGVGGRGVRPCHPREWNGVVGLGASARGSALRTAPGGAAGSRPFWVRVGQPGAWSIRRPGPSVASGGPGVRCVGVGCREDGEPGARWLALAGCGWSWRVAAASARSLRPGPNRVAQAGRCRAGRHAAERRLGSMAGPPGLEGG